MEPLSCTRPYPFAVQVSVEGNSRAVSANTDVICKDDTIQLAFGRALLSSEPLSVLGKQVQIRLVGVRDLAFNRADSVEWSFKVAEFDPLGASVSLSNVVFVDLALVEALESDQVSVTFGEEETRKRQLGSGAHIAIKSAKESGSGKSALTLASEILARDGVLAEGRIDVQAAADDPQAPAASTTLTLSVPNQTPVASENERENEESENSPFALTLDSKGLAVVGGIIAGGVLLCVLCILGVVCFFVRRGQATNEAEVPMASMPPPLQTYTVGRSGRVRRSSRRGPPGSGQSR